MGSSDLKFRVLGVISSPILVGNKVSELSRNVIRTQRRKWRCQRSRKKIPDGDPRRQGVRKVMGTWSKSQEGS